MVTLSKNCHGCAARKEYFTGRLLDSSAKKAWVKTQMAQNNPLKPALYKGARTGNHYGQAGDCRICPADKWMGLSDPAVKIGRNRHAI